MKKISFIFLFIIIFINSFSYITYAEDTSELPFSLKQEYKLYKERVQNICEVYKEKKQVVELEDNYLELEKGNYSLDEIKNTHRENMNSIYKCGILATQEKSLLLIKEELIKKNPDLIESLVEKIDAKIEVIRLSFAKFECIKSEEKNSVLKVHVLKQTTYQTCKYVSYMEYLKEYIKYVENVLPFKGNTHSIRNLIDMQGINAEQINEEVSHTYKVFPMAYHAYTEYENNITIHFLLQLIKEDYIILRDKLHKVLNPINQVIYKISNAMRL